MTINSEDKGGTRVITITGKNDAMMNSIVDLLKNISKQEKEKSEVEASNESMKAMVNVCRKGRPKGKSCFGNITVEERNALAQKTNQFFFEHFDGIRGCIVLDGILYKKEVFGALLSKTLIPRFNNQRDFINFLAEAGIEINYKLFMKALQKYDRGESKKENKMLQYLNHFYLLGTCEK